MSAALHQKLELLAKKDADAYVAIQNTMATEGEAPTVETWSHDPSS